MTTRRSGVRAALIALAGAATVAASPAAACVVSLFVDRIEGAKPLSKKARAAAEAAAAAAEAARTKADYEERLAGFRTKLTTGAVDPAIEIANMLIPNIRAINISVSSCGDADEYDTVSTDDWDRWSDAVYVGTELEGIEPERLPAFWRPIAVGPWACNEEFRERFAALLRARFNAEMIGSAYVALSMGYRPGHQRYYRFSGDRRVPPVVLDGYVTSPGTWPGDQSRFGIIDPQSPFSRAVFDFWAQIGERVADDEVACPNMRRRWIAARDDQIAQARTQPDYPQLLRDAAQARAARAIPNATSVIPIPADPAMVAKARELLTLMGAATYVQRFSYDANDRMIAKLVEASTAGQPRKPSADYQRLLRSAFELQIQAKAHDLTPAFLGEVAEIFARMHTKDSIDAAIAFYKSPAGTKNADALFATLLSFPQFENRVVMALLNDAPAVARKAAASEQAMRRVNAGPGK